MKQTIGDVKLAMKTFIVEDNNFSNHNSPLLNISFFCFILGLSEFLSDFTKKES
jgi:hypothetical protein